GRVVEIDIGEKIEVVRAWDSARCLIAGFAQASQPEKITVTGDQHVAEAVAGQVDQAGIGIAKVEARHGVEALESFPATVWRAFVKTGKRRSIDDQIGQTVATHIADRDIGLREGDNGLVAPLWPA